MDRKRGRRSAFTLIELLLVLVILGVLAAVVIPKMTGRQKEAKITATQAQISNIKSALSMFENDNGRFPTADEGLEALVRNPGNLENWHKVMDEVPMDAWGQPFEYRVPGTDDRDFDIISRGPDMRDGGGDDITN